MSEKPTPADFKDPDFWETRYQEGNLPWDSGEVDEHLAQYVTEAPAPGSRALDVGCGTGTNTIWLQRLGFDAVGVDLSPKAIEMANAAKGESGVECNFRLGDMILGFDVREKFDFMFDRGCFHTFSDPYDRSRFVENAARMMRPGGVWFSVIGSKDGPDRDSGPPRRSAVEIAGSVEPLFEIHSLIATTFDSDKHAEARAWIMVARRR